LKLSDLTAKQETFKPIHPDLGEIDGLEFTVVSPFSLEHSKASGRIHPEIFGKKSKVDQAVSWQTFQAEAIMIGWKGIEDDDGKPLKFNAKECSKVFRNPEYFWMVGAVNEHLSKKKGYLQTLTGRLDAMSE
tara:strand:- start:592 stop:987 length:396 start_codon:yes stop_codon:yes gene_type:complete